ncbi:MAG: alpha-L-fucosidase [Bacteroidales bacterium]|jgi:alpha-L-fucosidase|nr:alpha-L-fucosidase [Bacteroidales bacterium]
MFKIKIGIFAVLLTFCGGQKGYLFGQSGKEVPRYKEKLSAWQDLKFGMIIHWGLYAVPGIVESWSICSEDEDWIPRDSTVDYETYKRDYWELIHKFNPVDFNPEQWARVAEMAGMKYVIFTTKHHDGFALFDTKESDFKVTNSAFKYHPKADVARYVFEAFRQKGMMVGAYFSKPDWHSPYYWWSRYATPTRHVNYKIDRHPDRWHSFQKYTYNQIYEIVHNYGHLDILWLDGGWVAPPEEDILMDSIAKMVHETQPGMLIVDRTVGGSHEHYRTPEKQIPDKQLPYAWETCMPLSKDWGYIPNAVFKSSKEVIATLVEVVAKGGNLLLGIGPTPEGIIEPSVETRLQEIGHWLHRYGESLFATIPDTNYQQGNLWFTVSKKQDYAYAIHVPKLGEPAPRQISWQGHTPKKGTRIWLLNHARPLNWQTKNGITTVFLPDERILTDEIFALKIEISCCK